MLATLASPCLAAASEAAPKGLDHAATAPRLRMLRPRPAARRGRRDDLLVRVHLLPRLRDDPARRPLPQLRRRTRRPAAAAGGQARAISGLDRAGVQTGGLWRGDAGTRVKDT